MNYFALPDFVEDNKIAGSDWPLCKSSVTKILYQVETGGFVLVQLNGLLRQTLYQTKNTFI